MKRFYLPAICLLALLLSVGNIQLQAQQNTDKVIIIQKTQNDDGTVTIKKQRIDKGDDVNSIVEKLKWNGSDGNVKLMITSDGDDQKINTAGETIMYFRGSGEGLIKGCDTNKKLNELRSLHITIPDDNNFTFQDESNKPLLGVYPENTEKGVLLTGVVSGKGAEAAGLKTGDVLTSLNGVSLVNGLSGELAKYKPGDDVTVVYLRDGVEGLTKVKLSAKKSAYTYNYNYTYNHNNNYRVERDPCKVFIGVYVGSWGEGRVGVGVSGIVPGWPAEAAGLQGGDRITAIDGVPINTHMELVTERDKHKPGEYFTVSYLRDGVPGEVKAQFKECPKDGKAPAAKEEVVQEIVPETVLPPVEFKDNTLQLEEFTAYPNPTFGNLNVQFRGEAVPTNVKITDVTGRVVFEEQINNFDGYYSKEVNVSKGTPGTLMLSVSQNGKIMTKPVVLLNRA